MGPPVETAVCCPMSLGQLQYFLVPTMSNYSTFDPRQVTSLIRKAKAVLYDSYSKDQAPHPENTGA
jgi:hypothetical protein